MTNFERIIQAMSIAEYARMKSDANKCPSTRTLGQCSYYKKQHERSIACLFCWVDWLGEDFTE